MNLFDTSDDEDMRAVGGVESGKGQPHARTHTTRRAQRRGD